MTAWSAARRHPFLVALAAIVVVVAVVGGVGWWLHARRFESTDDAYIDARVVSVSPEVAGAVVDVPVTDNQLVTAGTPLVRLDPSDYQVAVDRAAAELARASAEVGRLDAELAAQGPRIEQARKESTAAQAALAYAKKQGTRYQSLLSSGSTTQQQAQQVASELDQRRAAFAGSQASVTAAERQLAVLRTEQQSARADVTAAQAALDAARLDLARVSVEAPVDGYVTELHAAKGDYVQPGQVLLALVPREVWVTANFKETSLDRMSVGQEVRIRIDAYPGRTFAGHVQSIQAGSGAAFSLLPPENATGNFVKIVQRVPVKIEFDQDPDVYVGPGMSVVPSVRVR